MFPFSQSTEHQQNQDGGRHAADGENPQIPTQEVPASTQTVDGRHAPEWREALPGHTLRLPQCPATGPTAT